MVVFIDDTRVVNKEMILNLIWFSLAKGKEGVGMLRHCSVRTVTLKRTGTTPHERGKRQSVGFEIVQ
jgi:hypothetical protein